MVLLEQFWDNPEPTMLCKPHLPWCMMGMCRATNHSTPAEEDLIAYFWFSKETDSMTLYLLLLPVLLSIV